jgi:hypothetical protein
VGAPIHPSAAGPQIDPIKKPVDEPGDITQDDTINERDAAGPRAHAHAPEPSTLGAAAARSSITFAEYYALNSTGNKQAHGLMAEHMNHFWDTMKGHETAHLGSDNAENGPDRRVDGINIQVKYHQTASRTFKSMFEKVDIRTGTQQLKYRTSDGFMKVEVPKDQYAAILELLRADIKAGVVEGITDPDMAQQVLKQGYYTYKEATLIIKPGTIAGLKYDIQTGAISGAMVGTATFVWRTVDRVREAHARTGESVSFEELVRTLHADLVAASKDAAWAVAMHVGTAQLLRLAKPDLLRILGRPFADGVLEALGEGGRQTLCSWLYKPLYGAAASSYLKKVISHSAVGHAVVLTVTSVPSMCRWATGKSTATECVTDVGVNAVHTAAGAGGFYAGAAAGAALGSVVPVLGTAVGGFVGGLVGSVTSSSAVSWMLPSKNAGRQARDEFDVMMNVVLIYALESQPAGVDGRLWAACLAQERLNSAVRADFEMLRAFARGTEFGSKVDGAHVCIEDIAPSVAAVLDSCRVRMARPAAAKG